MLGDPLGHQWPHSPCPPAPRPSLTAISHVSPGASHTVGKQLDLIREIMTVQRELQRQLGESQAEV